MTWFKVSSFLNVLALHRLNYVNICKLSWYVFLKMQSNFFHGVKTPGIDTKNSCVSDFVEKLEHFIYVRI